jgi:MFS family permease
MTGLVKVGTGAGQLIMPILAGICITRLGWRSAYSIIGLIVLVFVVGAGQLLRRDPAQLGQVPDGRDNTHAEVDSGAESGLSFADALRSGPFWMLCALNLLAVTSMFVILVHIVPHASDLGIATLQAAGILSTIGGVSMLGRFSTGFAIDWIGSRKCMRICLAILVASFIWLQMAHDMWTLYAFATIYGIAHGGIFTVISPLVAELFGIRSHGALFGLVAFGGNVGGAIGPILAGLVFDLTRSYDLIFISLIGLASLSLLLTLLLRPART